MKDKKKALKQAWEIFQPFRKHFAVMLVMLVCYEAFALFAPYFIGQVLNSIQAGESLTQVLTLIAIAFGFSLTAYAVGCIRDQYEIKHLDFSMANHLIAQTLEKVLSLSIGQHKSQNSGITHSVVNKGQGALQQMAFLLLYNFLPIVTTMLTTCILLLWFNSTVGFVVLAGIAAYLVTSVSTNRRYYPEVKRINDLQHKTNKYYTEILRLPSLILVQSQEKRIQAEHVERMGERLNENRKVWSPYSLRMWGNLTITTMIRYTALTIGALLIYRDGYRFGDFLIIWAWTNQATANMGMLNPLQRQWLNQWGEAKNFFAFLEVEPTVQVVSNPIKPERFLGEVEFINVAFTYPEQRYIKLEDEGVRSGDKKPSLPALTSVSFKIKHGERVAFVGESGAGKSTIVSLLTRSYDPDRGQIKVDGHDLRLLDLKSFRQALGVVEQDVALFDNTLRYNLLFGLNGRSQEVTGEDMERVARLSCIDRFQHRLTEGWDTMIGENGVKLSGGERQRVGIARALIKQSSILILDEATSSLDTENESLIKEAVREASIGRTTITIAHRLSTVRDVDRIFVMSRGTIVDQGSHDELLKTSDIYQNLVNKQLFKV